MGAVIAPSNPLVAEYIGSADSAAKQAFLAVLN